jgi:(4S)-4-hydroxy-5-phosphonooxypentane-2,3-dione isomerase
MIVNCVTVHVKTEHIIDFIEATRENHRQSVKEQGNLRFDFLQCASDPSRFFLYEAYSDDAASSAHKDTPHYLMWKETVAPWMAKPREGIAHRVIEPAGTDRWK